MMHSRTPATLFLVYALGLAACDGDLPAAEMAAIDAPGPTPSGASSTAAVADAVNDTTVTITADADATTAAMSEELSGPHDGCGSKCTRSNRVKWTREPNGVLQAVAVDSAGRILIAGSKLGKAGNVDMLLLALDATGKTLWSKTIAGTAKSHDRLVTVTVDAEDNIYIGGGVGQANGRTNAFLRKLTPKGKTVWTYRAAGTATSDATITDIAVQGDLVYTVGAVDALVPGDESPQLVRRHDLNDGTLLWQTELPESSPRKTGRRLAIIGEDAVVAGSVPLPSLEDRPMITVYSPDGEMVSNDVQDELGDSRWSAVAVTSNGELVLGGLLANAKGGGGTDIRVQRATVSGDAVWSSTFDFQDRDDFANAVAVGPGDIVAAAGFGVVFFGIRPVVQLLAADGTAVWTESYPIGSGEFTGAAFTQDALIVIGNGFSNGDSFVEAYRLD